MEQTQQSKLYLQLKEKHDLSVDAQILLSLKNKL